MSKMAVSFRIWAITILINASLFGIIQLSTGHFWLAMESVPLFFMSFVIGLPFWLITLVLIELTTRLPYSATGRMCWMAVTMAAFIALFYACMSWIVTGHFSLLNRNISLLTGTTIAAHVAALLLSRKALRKTVADTFISNNQ